MAIVMLSGDSHSSLTKVSRGLGIFALGVELPGQLSTMYGIRAPMRAQCLTLSVFSGPSEPEEKPASGEIAPDGHERVVDSGQEARMDGPGAGCCGSVDGQCT